MNKLTRRTLLKAGGVSLAVPFLGKGSPAMAETEQGWASYFDGNAFLINYGMDSPQDASKGTIIYLSRPALTSDNFNTSVFFLGRPTDRFGKVSIVHYNDSISGSWTADPDNIHDGFNGFVDNLPLTDGLWHL